MATRFYLPSDVGTGGAGTSSQRSSVLPAFEAGWETTGSTFKMLLKRAGVDPLFSSTQADRLWASNGTSGNDTASDMWISEPMLAQTISGTVKGMVQAKEASAAVGYQAAFVARVVSNDGSTFRGTLLSAYGGGTEYPTTISSIKFPPGWTGAGTALSSVTAQDGDRLVIELGTHQTTASAALITFNLGDGSSSDLTETEGGTTGRPWIEFSQTIIFSTDPAAVAWYAG